MDRQRVFLSLLVFISSCLSCLADKETDTKVAELLALQAKASSGVIPLETTSFERYAGGHERPYSLFVVADAKQFRNEGKLQLGKLLKAYSTVAKGFAKYNANTPAGSKVFFATIEYSDNKDVFGRMGIPGLPYLARIPPGMAVKATGPITLPPDDIMSVHDYPWGPEQIAGFVAERTGLPTGEVSEGTQSRSRLLPLFTLMVVGGLCFVGYKLYQAPFMRLPWLYAVGALFILWFSVSGGMYNIIRGVPLVGYDPRTRTTMMFMSGSGQLGAEGFILGSLYTSFGLIVAAFTRVLPTIKDESSRRAWGYGLVVAGFLVLNWVIGLHTWKTGMRSWWYIF